MKIKITSDRNPWANGSPCAKGQEIDVDDDMHPDLVSSFQVHGTSRSGLLAMNEDNLLEIIASVAPNPLN